MSILATALVSILYVGMGAMLIYLTWYWWRDFWDGELDWIESMLAILFLAVMWISLAGLGCLLLHIDGIL